MFSGSGIAGDADHRRHHQNNHDQDHGDANIVARGPLCPHPVEVSRRIRQGSAKQDGVTGIVKSERNHVGQNRKGQRASQTLWFESESQLIS